MFGVPLASKPPFPHVAELKRAKEMSREFLINTSSQTHVAVRWQLQQCPVPPQSPIPYDNNRTSASSNSELAVAFLEHFGASHHGLAAPSQQPICMKVLDYMRKAVGVVAHRLLQTEMLSKRSGNSCCSKILPCPELTTQPTFLDNHW